MRVGNSGRHIKLVWRLMILAGLLCSIGSAAIVDANDGQQFDRVGLRQQWFSHSGASGGDLVDWFLDINPNRSTTFFTIAGGDYFEKYSENDIGPAGQPYGVESGLRLANIKKEIAEKRLLAITGEAVPVTVTQTSLPESTLYTLAANASVRAFDAETGKVRWSTVVGSPRRTSYGIAASGNSVVVLNGTTVYCLSSLTGNVLWSKSCKGVPAAPPNIDSSDIFVPLINGRVERMSIDAEGFASISFVSGGGGAVDARPTLSPLSTCWGNYSGKLSLAGHNNKRGAIAFQLNTDGPILSSPVFKDGMYYATSLDGYVYGVSEQRGSLVWENGTGFGISQSPFVVGNDVYVVNDKSQLFKFDAKTGRATDQWQRPRENVGQFAGASQSKIYTLDDSGLLKALDRDRGTVIGQTRLRATVAVLANLKSDRIYVMDAGGAVRCLSEVTAQQPFFHSDEFVPEKEKMMAKPDDGQKTEGSTTREANPFTDDPFADDAPAKKSKDSSDPFADDPFADDAPAKTDDGDPFADDDNPFIDN